MKKLLTAIRDRLTVPPMPEPLTDDHKLPIPSAKELADDRERRIADIVAAQAEGNVLLSDARIDDRNFSLFDEEPVGEAAVT